MLDTMASALSAPNLERYISRLLLPGSSCSAHTAELTSQGDNTVRWANSHEQQLKPLMRQFQDHARPAECMQGPWMPYSRILSGNQFINAPISTDGRLAGYAFSCSEAD